MLLVTPSRHRRFQKFLDPETGKVIRERQARAPSDTKPAQMESSFQVWNSEPSEVIRERWKDMFYAVLLETPSWHKKVPSLRALGPDSPISLSGVWAVPARGPANESVSNPGHYHGGLAPASNSRGFWIISVGHIRVALSLGRFTRGTTPSNGRGRAGPE